MEIRNEEIDGKLVNVLYPDEGKELICKIDKSIYITLILNDNDSEDNYEEIDKPKPMQFSDLESNLKIESNINEENNDLEESLEGEEEE